MCNYSSNLVTTAYDIFFTVAMEIAKAMLESKVDSATKQLEGKLKNIT